jgi:hypothetical protein
MMMWFTKIAAQVVNDSIDPGRAMGVTLISIRAPSILFSNSGSDPDTLPSKIKMSMYCQVSAV